MTNLVKKLDSNVTGLRYAEEASIGVLPLAASQTWYPLEPNTYNEFGAQTKTVARQPISPSRQIHKGVLTDLDPNAGFTHDLLQNELTRLLQGFFFANLRESYDSAPYNGSQGVIGSATASSHAVAYNSTTAVSAVLANELVKLSGFTKAANTGLFEVASITETKASQVLTSSANYADAETVTIGSNVYTLQDTLTNVAGHVKIGASEAATILNLHHAINGTGGVSGTDYAAATVAHPSVTATDDAAHALTVTAILYGTTANAIATTETSATASWGAVTLAGGIADVVFTAGLADEAAPAGARLEVVGYQGASADLTITNDGTDYPVLGSSILDFTTLPLIPGQWLWIGGDTAASEFATLSDNGWARIRTLAAHAISFDKTSSEMVTDAGTGKTVQLFWGKVLRNEADPSFQVRRTYSLERSLGNPDADLPTKPQAEYVSGSVSNEVTVNMTTAEKVTLDMTFMGTDYTTIDQNGTILSQVGGATAPAVVSEDAFNTTSHVVRAKMSVLSKFDGAPTSLFAEITEFKFMAKNNLKPNKAVGKLGPFEITAGFFEGSGSVQAYFDTVASVQAVRTNADVSIDFAVAKDNQGILFDLPLLTLQTKGLDVKINEPIMLPIDMTMGADRVFNHTLLMEFFDYLPTAAMPV